MMAQEQGCIGIATTNTSPWVMPTRSAVRALGTNAFAAAAPAGGEDTGFVMDMATSAVPIGKVEVMHRKGAKVPLGWGVDSNGEPTTDPEKIIVGGGLMPLGGAENTAGYKGYAIGMLIETMSAVAGDSPAGINVQPWLPSRKDPIDYAHCFIAMDCSKMHGGFEQRMHHYCEEMRGLPTARGAPGPVQVPGDPEAAAYKKAQAHGVTLNQQIAGSVKALGQRLKVPLPQSFDKITVVHTKHLLA
jgi:LDH2 family malate/lactate/ureidoglycolate dehydrogenase